METVKKEIRTDRYEVISEMKEIEEFVCSDGRHFDNKKRAENWEDGLNKYNIIKKELKFKSITPFDYEYSDEPNEGFEPEFCFYYHPELSKDAKSFIHNLVFKLNFKEATDLKTGWYYCNQSVWLEDNGSISGSLNGDVDFYLIEDHIQKLEESTAKKREFLNELNQILN